MSRRCYHGRPCQFNTSERPSTPWADATTTRTQAAKTRLGGIRRPCPSNARRPRCRVTAVTARDCKRVRKKCSIRDIDVRLREDPDLLSGEAYFTLYEQLSSLLQPHAFPSLRFVRDMGHGSHRMRSRQPAKRILQFWQRVVDRCRERQIWLEDCHGVNITRGSLLRAAQTHFLLPGGAHQSTC